MLIEYIGHSCFKIESNGYSIILDPYADGSVPGLSPVVETANLILCSHDHLDHCGKEHITIVDADSTPLKVTTIASFHDEVQGAKRGKNTIHLIDDGTVRLAHLGDLGCELTDAQAKPLMNLDVLLIPVGGTYTIDGIQAANIVCQLHPRIIIPMHYRDGSVGYNVLDTVNAFVERMDSVATYPSSCIDAGENHPCQVLVLQPRNRK